MIAQQVPEVPRIGIDGDLTLSELDILDKKADVEEIYIPGQTHLKAVEENIDDFEEPVDLEYLRQKRIEIDAVLKEVGPERFANWIMARLEEIFGGEQLDYNRSIKIPDANQFVPDELRELNTVVIDLIKEALGSERYSAFNKLAHYTPDDEGGLIEDVEEYEYQLFDDLQDVVDEHADTRPIINDINRLLKKFGPKQK